MAAIKGQSEIARMLVKSLGLDPKKTQKVVLTIAADDLITVDVKMLPDKGDLGNIALELKRFQLYDPEKNE